MATAGGLRGRLRMEPQETRHGDLQKKILPLVRIKNIDKYNIIAIKVELYFNLRPFRRT